MDISALLHSDRTNDGMLFDLEWLSEGEIFPPKGHKARLDRYKRNKALFESGHDKVYKKALNRIRKIVGDLTDVPPDPIVLNYNKLVALKTADLVCGEAPTITYDGASSDVINAIRKYTNLDTLLYETIIDVSRFGDAVWRLYKNEEGKGQITIWEPTEWFPVVSPDDKKRITHHVLARTIYKGQDPGGKKFYELLVQIHEKGKYEQRIYELKEDGRIGKLLDSKEYKTGFDDFAVIHIPNITTSDSIFGHDDYAPLDTIICELMVRFTQIQKILDKHANPSMKGPMSALEESPSGEWVFRVGNYFSVNPGDPEPGYLTWDGNLDAAFKEIEKLVDQLLIISEMGAAFLSTNDSAGRAASGTSLRLRMLNPLTKARRLIDPLDEKLKIALSEISKIGYEKALEKDKIEITWHDGLPNNPMEDAQLMAIRTGHRPTISRKRAIMYLENLNEEQAQKILDEIQEDEPSFGEFNFPGMDLSPEIDDDELDTETEEDGS